MTPTPQAGEGQSPNVAPHHDGQIVISGMSGLYPKSRYIRDLENVLYNKINPISTDDLRWKYNHPEVAQYAGNVPDLDRFDAQFFKVHYRLANSMDSMSRKLLEQAYAAIYDAGVSPEYLSGKKVGVYIGTCFSETEKACFYVATSRTGFGIAGCSKAMFANRLSYWLNAKGPSLSIDGACCSSTTALEQAYVAMTRGDCEAAIVGGANLNLHPQSSVHYGRIMNLSKDGKTRSFDQNAAGCAKTEAINVLFLQKAKDARRIYADVCHVKCEFIKIQDGNTGPKYGFNRDTDDTAGFLKRFYESIGVPPSIVEYVEGCGSAVPEADKTELEALDKVLCHGRSDPLLVGSVMSNIGYSEAASGISAITKVLLGYHRGEIAGNLNYENPRNDVAAIQDRRIRVLNDHHQFRRTYAAVNSMSVTGLNGHVLLHGHYKPKDLNKYKTNIPYLVMISGRQDTSVQRVLDELKSHPVDPEELALLQNIHETRINGHLGRGYVILDTKDGKTVGLAEQVDYFDDAKRPLWFVYSGMGSQWPGMGRQLMRLPIFAAAIERCNQILKSKGIDIFHIITSPDKSIFDNILHSFVGIAAVQIGLTDVMKELGLVPDKIIGHSVGELGCAYADGCFTAEEMILAAYSRGLASLETPFIKGSMAAVGLGFQQISKLCPPEIEIACHNSSESCTISGPANIMKMFVSELTTKGIFAREVPCSNIAYHSRYIAEAGPTLLKYLKDIIKTPKLRSDRWVSTSVPQERWNEPASKYSSAEYHTNNLLSPVLFEEASAIIPSNAVLVEIAPHGLLQAILKRSLPESCANIPLTRRGHADSSQMILEALGKLYMVGYNPKIQFLYPKVEFPVSTGTPFLSHLVDWAHTEKWTLPLYVSAQRQFTASCNFLISVHDDEYSYMKGHVIRRKTQVPFSFALVAAWDTLCMSLRVPKKELNVVFSEVTFYAQPVLYDQQTVKLNVALQRGNGRFEIINENSRVASGFINVNDKSIVADDMGDIHDHKFDLCSQDIYTLLHEREYAYSGDFRSIQSVNDTCTVACILWNNNWVTHIDALLQFNALKHRHNAVSVPSEIRKISIDVMEHKKYTDVFDDDIGKTVLKAYVSEINDFTRCGGILIENITFHDLSASKEKAVELKTLKFVPRIQCNLDYLASLQVIIQVVAENISRNEIKIVGVASKSENVSVFKDMSYIASVNNIPGIKINYQLIRSKTAIYSANLLQDTDIFLVQNLSTDTKITQLLNSISRDDVYIVNEDKVHIATDNKKTTPHKLVPVMTNKTSKSRLELLKFKPSSPAASVISAIVRSEKDLPALIASRNKLTPQSGLIIVSSYPPLSGLKSLVKHWRKDSSRNNINLIMVNDDDPKKLAKLSGDLAYNILDNGVWGGEYYLPLKESDDTGCEIALRSRVIGNLESLHWVQAQKLKTGISVKVHYAGINMNDVLRASAVIPNTAEIGYGMEFSGVTESGQKVMGLISNGAAQSYVIAQPELLWPVPPHWTLEDAATVPLAYVYAYYCFNIRTNTNLREINRVLVHGGSGALGQAAISIALARGCEIYTTVSDVQKKKLLLRLFPTLREENIWNSRDQFFGDKVLSATKGQCCDLIICCLKKEFKHTSLKCCSNNAFMCDTVETENQDVFKFGMHWLTKERNYLQVNISSFLQNAKPGDIKKLQLLVSQGIVNGDVRPLTRVTYAPQEVTRAFRLLSMSRHRGRVLIRLNDENLPIKPRLTISGNGCHVVFCDSQPLGLEIINMLINSGAKMLHLHFPYPQTYLRYKQSQWSALGVKVSVTSEDLIDEDSISTFFQEISRSGYIEGVYVAAQNISRHTMLSMDLAIRKLCPSLKHFLMFSQGDDSVQYISIKRAKDRLPSTVLNLSMLDVNEDEEGLIWYRDVSEAAERGLLSSHPVLLAQSKDLPKESLIQQIAKLCGLVIPESIDYKTTLKDLKVDRERSLAIACFLRNMHNVSINENEIPLLTIERLTQIENSTAETVFENVEGLRTFFSYVDPDEMLATTEIVFMPTLTNSSTMRDDEIDVNETFMCVVPGLEGHHERFRSLCERLKLPALVVQPGLDHLHETPEELALRYSKVVLQRAGMRKSFYILCYETGVQVALELAAIFEKHSQTGTVFCIGDGPEEIKALLKEQLREYTNTEDLQKALVEHMFTLMTGDKSAQLEMREGDSWRQRVDACVRTLLGQVSHSAQYARGLIEATYARITNTINYNATPKALSSKIVVLRALSSYSTSSIPCTLQRYSRQPISVYNLTTTLAHAAQDKRCPSIINKYLSSDILEAFDKKNLCETYLLNADTFMQ